jgi:superfamily II DNA or RNA helicase
MSLKLNISNLTSEVKAKINKELKFHVQTGRNKEIRQTIIPYHIPDDQNHIYVPLYYAIEAGIGVPSDTYMSGEMEFKGTLRDYQRATKRDVIDRLNEYGACLLSLPVGWGKTIFSIYISCKIRLKTLILVNRLVLMDQWVEAIKSVCSNPKIQVLKTKSELDLTNDFFIMNALNVSKKPLDFFRDIGTLICDEVHLLCSPTQYQSFFRVCPRYSIALSATPTRLDGMDKLLEFFFSRDKIEQKLVKKHYVQIVHTGITFDQKYNSDGSLNWNSVINGQAISEPRNRMIISIIQKNPERNMLVLCKRLVQGEWLIDQLTSMGESVTDLIRQDKYDPNARILVATIQKCGVGFSHEKMDSLILAGDLEEKYIQVLGRVFRSLHNVPLIFDIVDENPILQRHLTTRKRVYKETGGIISTVKFY